MGVKLEDFLDRLPEEERAVIVKEMKEAVEQEKSLRQLREARRKSQVEIAERLLTSQAAVSRMERRTDLYLSTLRKYVKAMGGELEVTARFPDGPPVKFSQFSDE